MREFDLSVFYVLHGLAGRAGFFDWIIVGVGEYLLYPLLFLVLYSMFVAYRKGQAQNVYWYSVSLVAAAVARLGLAEFIRFFYHRPRPYTGLHLRHLLTDMEYSFPSGHTIFLFALATSLLYVNKRLAYVMYSAAVLIGVARVIAGVHYPSDIVGGAVLGTIVGYVVCEGWKRYRRRVSY